MAIAATLAVCAATASAGTPKRIDLVDVELIDPVQVTAKATGDTFHGLVIPGAIICDSYDKADEMAWRYEQHATDVMQDKATGGRSKLIRGKPMAEPVVTDYGCVLVPAGRPMTWGRGNQGAPIVSAVSKNGITVTGVTLMTMMEFNAVGQ
ncbi:hypothetical protein [Asticcacaulis solisilvae]|uniref:hypothetical protein n=1 Tax=Asticcacaulis solisilvae TaxID=1217274 RepID=UPI003FD8BB49